MLQIFQVPHTNRESKIPLINLNYFHRPPYILIIEVYLFSFSKVFSASVDSLS